MDSIWTENTKIAHRNSLNGDIKTDVLVIGGGMAGLLTAYMLTRSGVDCAVAEARRICGGVTADTTAKITVQHGLIYSELIKRFGVEKAKMYLEANRAALKKYREMCVTVDCDFEQKNAYTYSTDDRRALEYEAAALDRLGCAVSLVNSVSLPVKTVGAVKVPGQAQFDPLKFAAAVAKRVKIYENTTVRELIGTTAVTDRGKISAKTIAVATHFPFINKHGSYFLKMYQHRSYVLALKNAAQVDGMYVDESKKGLSFRNYGDLLLVGGGSHRTGKQGGGWRELAEFASRAYPLSNEVARWATQDCMTLDGIPYIGRYSRNTPNMYVATGFNKWGMTSSMAAAMILRDMILGKRNEYAPVFSPSRTILRPQLAVNAVAAVGNLLTPTAPRCPHMGCALKRNRQEHTWDCPCHGSRFTYDGQLIDNPSTGDSKSIKRKNAADRLDK